MTIVKWKKPTTDGQKSVSPVTFNSPFSGLFENLLGEEYLTREFASYVPAANFSEGKEKYNLDLSAPGFEKEDFKIEVNKGVLTVSGEHKTEKETEEKNFTRKEFIFGSFQRSFVLPEEVDENAIDAKYENGILRISLAKKAELQKASIEIKVS